MGKVYFDKDKNEWVVYQLEDYYSFKCINCQTNEESNHILSWSRRYDMSDMSKSIDRVYDVEIEGEKYYFLFYNNGGEVWSLSKEDPMKLEKLLQDKNLFFVGETKIVD
jgi:hypothetical protein